MTVNKNSNTLNILGIVLVAIIVAVVVFSMMQPGESKLDRAAEKFENGVSDAADELKPHKTTSEKIGDAVKDVGEDIKNSDK